MFGKIKSAVSKARNAASGAVIEAAEKAENVTGGDLSDYKVAASHKGTNGFRANTRAQGASQAVNLVVALVVGGLMAAFLLPIAIDEIAAVDTTSWDNGAAALWGILPVMVVLAVFLFFVGVALSRSGRI